jgi:PKD repeat protein
MAHSATHTNSTIKPDYITVSAPEAPVAAFTGTPLTGTAPLDVTFTDSSTGTSITSREWDFGDGNITSYAVSTNPVHRYTSAGTYTVNLTVTNALGSDSLLLSGYITVSAMAPVAAFTGTPLTGTTPLDVTFTDSSTGTSITNRNWDFGDGNITSYAVAINPVHRYTGAGTYTVNLTVTNAAGSDSLIRTNYISVSAPANTATRVGVFRPSTHTFYLRPANWPATPTSTINWGVSTDIPVTGDWNGDGSTNVGVFRPSTHTFYLRNGTTSWTTTAINWGTGTDLPVTGDWNADGITNVGVFRPSTHTFYLRNGTTTWTTTAINWGASTDLPVTGDWNGDGITDVGVFRPSTHTFYLRNGTTSWTTTAINWGASTDLPVTGDWNMDGTTEVGVFRPSTHTFYLRPANWPATPTSTINWGVSTDLPVTGTW